MATSSNRSTLWNGSRNRATNLRREVTQKGDIALRGGILDVYPMTSPWPVRLEFFGDELESLRHFDPLSQISREPIKSVTLPPGGELGMLKQLAAKGAPPSFRDTR